MNYKFTCLLSLLLFVFISKVGNGAELKGGILRVLCTQESTQNNEIKTSQFEATTFVRKFENSTMFHEGSALFVSYKDENGKSKNVYVQPFKRVVFSLSNQDVLTIRANDFSPGVLNLEDFLISINFNKSDSVDGKIIRTSTRQFALGQIEDSGSTEPYGDPKVETYDLGGFSCRFE